MIILDITGIELKLRHDGGRPMVFDPVRKSWFVLTPEEHLRQYVLRVLIDKMGYPASLVSVEKMIDVAGMDRRFDIIVYGRDHTPWMLVECKRPDVPITQATLHQLLAYQNVVRSRYWLLTNGPQAFCADAADVADIQWLTSLPAYPF
ncbi:hypothetical protein GCM10023093_02370 [Nemorincola caseinilytica]|uniref:Type I restriction enzyme R protein N-terminal domain-containing protein n=1 Tax=Nemorincola caseinilytica TaxID=2054315 RepID=A0ABP8N2H8_9BACT